MIHLPSVCAPLHGRPPLTPPISVRATMPMEANGEVGMWGSHSCVRISRETLDPPHKRDRETGRGVRFLGDQSIVVFVLFEVNKGNDARSYRGGKEGKTDSFPATITNPVHITIPVHLWRCGSIHRYSHHLPVNRMSVRRDTETGGRCRGLRWRSDVCWSFFLFSFFL